MRNHLVAVVHSMMVRHLAKRALAMFLVLLLLLTQFSPLTSVTITPARAGFDSCVNIAGDYIAIGATLVNDFANPLFPACTAKIAGGDVVLIGVMAALTGMAATGLFKGGGSAVGQCNAMIGSVVAKVIVQALADLYKSSGSTVDGVFNDIFGGQSNVNYLFNTVANESSEQIMQVLSETPPFSLLLSELSCGCELVGAAIDIGKDAEQLAKDSLKCASAAWDAAKAVASVIESGVEAAAELGECILSDVTGGFIGACPQGVQDAYCESVGYSDAQATYGHNWYSGMIACGPGAQCGTVPGNGLAYNSDPSGQTLVNNGCVSCLGGPHVVSNPSGGGEKGEGCTCGDNYNAKYNSYGQLLSCQCEIGFQQIGDSDKVECGCAPGQRMSGGLGNRECKSCGSGSWSFDGKSCLSCPYLSEVLSPAGCQQCPVGTKASYPGGDLTKGTCERLCPEGQTNSGGDYFNPVCTPTCGANSQTVVQINNKDGVCYTCPPGTSSAAGDSSCAPLNCSPVQKYSGDGGHSCVTCDSTVLLSPDGSTALHGERSGGVTFPVLIPPGAITACADPDRIHPDCAWGTKESWLTCQPLHCQGTDHPDDDGHSCVTCQNVAQFPAGVFGGESEGFSVMSTSGGALKVELANGKSLSVGPIETKGGIKSVKVTSADGKTQQAGVGGKPTPKTVAVCLDPDTNPAHRKNYSPSNMKIPGLQIEREKPDLNVQDYKPNLAYPGNLLGNGSTPGGDGNNPIIQNPTGFTGNAAATATGMPFAMPGRRPPPPQPGGGSAGTVPAQGDNSYSSHSVPAEGDKSGSSRTVPAEGDGKGNGPYKGVNVLAEPDAPTSTGPARRSKGKDDGKTDGPPPGGYKSFTLESKDASEPISTGPHRNSRGKDGGYTSRTDPAKGDGTNGNVYKYDKDEPFVKPKDSGSSKGTPDARPTPGLNNGPELRATPRLNDGPEMRTVPRLNDGPQQQLRAPPSLNSDRQLRTTPQVSRTPQPSNNATQSERIRPSLNDSRSGPSLSPGTGAPTNPFAR